MKTYRKLHSAEKLALNNFINNQIILFQWVDFENIGASPQNLAIAEQTFTKIFGNENIELKLDNYIETVKEIYKTVGIGKGTDEILTFLIILILKTVSRNILLNYEEIIRFLIKKKSENCGNPEIEYYITLLGSAINFIKNLEYRNLNVKKEYFDAMIEKYSKQLDLETIIYEKDDLSYVFFYEKLKEKTKKIYKKTKDKIKKHF